MTGPSRISLVAAVLAMSPLSAQADITYLPTSVTGGGAAFTNKQPTLALNQVIQSEGNYPLRDGTADVETYWRGTVRTFAWRVSTDFQAAGQTLAISSNAALFSLLGTTYGGDGMRSFRLPDLKERIIVGAGSAAPVGDVLGSATNALFGANMPGHVHGIPGKAVTTTPAGAGIPFGNVQPSLAMTYMVQTSGIFPSSGGSGPATSFMGQVRAFSGYFVPAGYLPADGRLMSISSNTALFALFGTTYGGDGKTTFALPDLRGRTAIGAGAGPGLTPRALGSVAGAEIVALTASQMPAHTHELPLGDGPTLPAGGNQPFDNMQPSLALNYLIATEGIYPSFERPLEGSTLLGEVVASALGVAPRGWSFADGSLMDISSHAALFSLLGTTYGGDGVRTFALPDLRGRTIEGMGEAYSTLIGRESGAETVTLTTANLPPHLHLAPVPEPETYALMLAGLGLLGGFARRRRPC